MKGGYTMEKYDIYMSGSERIGTIYATCISKACKSFIDTLEKPAKYTLQSKEYASIRYTNNYTITSDYVVIQA